MVFGVRYIFVLLVLLKLLREILGRLAEVALGTRNCCRSAVRDHGDNLPHCCYCMLANVRMLIQKLTQIILLFLNPVQDICKCLQDDQKVDMENACSIDLFKAQ